MVVKLALGNVRRCARDFSVYYLTQAVAACLLYSFYASTDYLLALDLTVQQMARFEQAGGVLGAFSVLIVLVFAFLLGYANVFLVRRRSFEFALLELVGMSWWRIGAILVVESGVVSGAALVSGVAAGCALSPVFGGLAAFVFGAGGQPGFMVSVEAAGSCALAFAAIEAIAAWRAVRTVRRRPLVELMQARRSPERPRLQGRAAVRSQRVVACVLLAIVWGCCLLQPGYFIVFIIPMGFIALGGTYLLFRVLAVRVPARLRARRDRYWSGLAPFTVRQVEAHLESGCMALAAVAVLVAAGMCLVVAGLAFSVGLREGAFAGAATTGLEPVAFACVFYGAAFLVAAAAVLALRQLSEGLDAERSYRVLERLGVAREAMRASVARQVGIAFVVPLAMACVHCVFGFSLIGLITIMTGAAGYAAFAAGTLGLTMALFAGYYLITVGGCIRGIVPRAGGRR